MNEREKLYQAVRAKLIGYYGEDVWTDQAASEIMTLVDQGHVAESEAKEFV